MIFRTIYAMIAVIAFAGIAVARPPVKVQAAAPCSGPSCNRAATVQDSFVIATAAKAVANSPSEPMAESDALAEVNAERAKRGLRPFINDPNLAAGALHVARFRARGLIEGHSGNDFAGLPVGATAKTAGCAAWHPHLGWGACETYSTAYTQAGAAWVMGRDGRRYMHLFLR